VGGVDSGYDVGGREGRGVGVVGILRCVSECVGNVVDVYFVGWDVYVLYSEPPDEVRYADVLGYERV